MKRLSYFILLALIVSNFSCRTAKTPTGFEAQYIQLDSLQTSVADIESLIKPYREGLEGEMTRVIGTFAHEMFKKKPEGELGNFMCDATLDYCNSTLNANADVAFMNYGGIRTTYINQGPVTVERMFELMPFENTVVVLTLTGDSITEFFKRMANSGGWPVSKNVGLIIKNNALETATINGEPIDAKSTYRVLLTDYVANGGDGNSFLTTAPRENFDILLRDVLIKYCEQQTALGKKIEANLTERVKYVE